MRSVSLCSRPVAYLRTGTNKEKPEAVLKRALSSKSTLLLDATLLDHLSFGKIENVLGIIDSVSNTQLEIVGVATSFVDSFSSNLSKEQIWAVQKRWECLGKEIEARGTAVADWERSFWGKLEERERERERELQEREQERELQEQERELREREQERELQKRELQEREEERQSLVESLAKERASCIQEALTKEESRRQQQPLRGPPRQPKASKTANATTWSSRGRPSVWRPVDNQSKATPEPVAAVFQSTALGSAPTSAPVVPPRVFLERRSEEFLLSEVAFPAFPPPSVAPVLPAAEPEPLSPQHDAAIVGDTATATPPQNTPPLVPAAVVLDQFATQTQLGTSTKMQIAGAKKVLEDGLAKLYRDKVVTGDPSLIVPAAFEDFAQLCERMVGPLREVIGPEVVGVEEGSPICPHQKGFDFFARLVVHVKRNMAGQGGNGYTSSLCGYFPPSILKLCDEQTKDAKRRSLVQIFNTLIPVLEASLEGSYNVRGHQGQELQTLVREEQRSAPGFPLPTQNLLLMQQVQRMLPHASGALRALQNSILHRKPVYTKPNRRGTAHVHVSPNEREMAVVSQVNFFLLFFAWQSGRRSFSFLRTRT